MVYAPANSLLPVRLRAESPNDDLLPFDWFKACLGSRIILVGTFGFFELLDSRWGDWPPYSDRMAM